MSSLRVRGPGVSVDVTLRGAVEKHSGKRRRQLVGK